MILIHTGISLQALSVSEPPSSPVSTVPPIFLSPTRLPASSDGLHPPQPSHWGKADATGSKTAPSCDKGSEEIAKTSREIGQLVPVGVQAEPSEAPSPTQWRVVPINITPTTMVSADDVAERVSSLMKNRDTPGSVTATLSGHELAKLLATTPSLHLAQGDKETSAALARLRASMAQEGLDPQGKEPHRPPLPSPPLPRIVSVSSIKTEDESEDVSCTSSEVPPTSSSSVTSQSLSTSTPSTLSTPVTSASQSVEALAASRQQDSQPTPTTSQTKTLIIDIGKPGLTSFPAVMAAASAASKITTLTSSASSLTTLTPRTMTSRPLSPATVIPTIAQVKGIGVPGLPGTAVAGGAPNIVIMKPLNTSGGPVISQTPNPGAVVNKPLCTVHIKTE